MKRFGIAAAIALVIYGLALGAGSLLYATGRIATGPTHNECGDLKPTIAKRDFGGEEKDVPQSVLKQETIDCLAGNGLYEGKGHELTEKEAFQTEYLFWSIWPGIICAVIFLLWPRWSQILINQEQAELAEDPPRLEPGS